MKLRTSYFNGSVLKKDITRFLPVWGLYSVFLFMALLILNWDSAPAETAYAANNIIAFTSVINFIYAFICAGTLFGDLYVSKMCNALHAMPMRREGWFLTHFAAGFLFSFLPNLLAAAASYPLLRENYFVAYIWLGASTLQFLFFFGLALLCTFCVGNRLGLAALYGILNFFAQLVYGFISALYLPLLKGVTLSWDAFAPFSPVVQMACGGYVDIVLQFDDFNQSALFKGFIAADWNYLFLMAATGIVLTVVALMLYRFRHLERAGDFLAFKGLAPVFLGIVTLASGLVFYMLVNMMTGRKSYLFLVIGMAVGFFVAKMLLEQTVRVFRRKPVIAFVILTAVTLGSFYVTHLDPMKLQEKIPAADEIETCRLNMVYPSPYQMTDTSRNIDEIRDIHQQLITAEPVADSGRYPVSISYTLKNGKNLTRKYTVYEKSPISQQIERMQSAWSVVFQTDDFDSFASSIRTMQADLWDRGLGIPDVWDATIPEQYHPELLAAMKADCEEGTLAQGYMFYDKELIAQIRYDFAVDTHTEGLEDYHRSGSIEIPGEAKNTRQVLDKIMADIRPTDGIR